MHRPASCVTMFLTWVATGPGFGKVGIGVGIRVGIPGSEFFGVGSGPGWMIKLEMIKMIKMVDD
jgi:hypothetical protein